MRVTAALRQALTIGIRREDPSRIWERRCPLTPDAVRRLVTRKGVQVHVEHCDRRIFKDEEFVEAGACIQPDLRGAHITLGIKEPPLDTLIQTPPPPIPNGPPSRIAMMFSHTLKGQPYNMPLLSRFVSGHSGGEAGEVDGKLPRLIDFELLTDDTGKRTVGFGWFAGVAGVLESLSSMAHSHLEHGIASPFLYTPRPNTMPSLQDLRAALRGIGEQIRQHGTPKRLGPFVIGLTGSGKVSQGCLDILEELPVVHVEVADLPRLVEAETRLNNIYVVHARSEDCFSRTDGKKYSRTDYYLNPQLYESHFDTKVAPYLTLFLNGAGWAPGFPRMLTNSQLATAIRTANTRFPGQLRFQNVGDISCDVEGGLEFLSHATTLSRPFDTYRPKELEAEGLPGVQTMAVDILPTAIPLDASRHFSDALSPYLEALIDRYIPASSLSSSASEREGLEVALERATITQGGVLQEKHAWLKEKVDAWRQTLPQPAASQAVWEGRTSSIASGKRKKRILMLGSGMVAGPAVEKIASRRDVHLVIVSNARNEQFERYTEKHAGNVEYRIVARFDDERLIQESDVVISLLPAGFHVQVAELCIKHRKHLVTASYISDGMRTLHSRAIDADVLLLNEIGLDPGIDHCSAIDLITRLKAENKDVVSFISFCGGLPSPDLGLGTDRMGPLGYKFSWSPRGVLTAALNPARYRLRGETMEVPGEELLESAFEDVPVTSEFRLEGIPNRDSFPYAETYELGRPEGLRTLLRGTLRYPGFSEAMHSFKQAGLLDLDQSMNVDAFKSWISGLESSKPRAQVALRWLLQRYDLDNSSQTQELPRLNLFADLLAKVLRYERGEKDMVVLAHELVAQPGTPTSAAFEGAIAPGGEEEVHRSTLIAYGSDEHSAMALTVGLPVAIAALSVLDRSVPIRGVAGPEDLSVRRPVLEQLEGAGLGVKEERLPRGRTSIEETLQTVRQSVLSH